MKRVFYVWRKDNKLMEILKEVGVYVEDLNRSGTRLSAMSHQYIFRIKQAEWS